jgi:predicted outer membrane protein
MRKTVVLLTVALLIGCGRRKIDPDGAFRERRFIISTIQSAASNDELAVMATKRGALAETRELGALLHREQPHLRSDLMQLAERRGLGVEHGLEEKKTALKENLAILQGQLFDQAYALAMSQELDVMFRSVDLARRSNDTELRTIADHYRDTIAGEQQRADALLKQLGGSPW